MLGFGASSVFMYASRSLLMGGFAAVDGWVGLVHRLLYFRRRQPGKKASRHIKLRFKGLYPGAPFSPKYLFNFFKRSLCVCVCVCWPRDSVQLGGGR